MFCRGKYITLYCIIVYNCYNLKGFRTSYHPLGTLAINLIKAFELSYSSLNAKLLPHAVREVKYVLDRTSQIIELV